MKRAVVLLSGGIDSATTLAIAKHEGFSIYPMSIDYGQRHLLELESAKKIAASLSVDEHLIIKIELNKIGGSALTSSMKVPKERKEMEKKEIPITYVPARNTILLSLALSWAEVIDAEDIFIGANAVDYSGYPDCRPAFLEAFEKMANLATKASVEGKRKMTIRAPLITLTKSQIIKKGLELNINYGLTWSCYDPTPEGLPCGQCDSCYFRKKGFLEARIKDPLMGC